jgi:hypothetical protein
MTSISSLSEQPIVFLVPESSSSSVLHRNSARKIASIEVRDTAYLDIAA